MTRIGLLSDTHGYFDERIAHHLRGCDEIWHAGDFGDAQVVDELRAVANALSGRVRQYRWYGRAPNPAFGARF